MLGGAPLSRVLLAAIGTFLVGVLVCEGARRLALRWGLVDRPGGRKHQLRPVPTAGGLALFVTLTIVATGWLLALPTKDAPGFGAGWGSLPALWVGALVLLVAGIVDDRIELGALAKLAVQAVAVLPLLGYAELRLLPTWLGPAPSSALTLLWFLTLINAINLLDGHDGLAASVGLIGGGILAGAAVLSHQTLPALLLGALSGALAAFLPFNLPPARVYLGNGGSMLLGYLLAACAVLVSYGDPAGPLRPPWYSVLTPLVVFAVPLQDLVVVAVLRRRQGRQVWLADRQHLHHRLARLGHGTWGVLLVVCACSLATGLGGLMLANLAAWQAAVVAAQTAMILLVMRLLERAPPSADGAVAERAPPEQR